MKLAAIFIDRLLPLQRSALEALPKQPKEVGFNEVGIEESSIKDVGIKEASSKDAVIKEVQ